MTLYSKPAFVQRISVSENDIHWGLWKFGLVSDLRYKFTQYGLIGARLQVLSLLHILTPLSLYLSTCKIWNLLQFYPAWFYLQFFFFFHFCLFFNEYITYTWPQLFVSLNPLYSKNTSTLRFIINLYNMVSWIKIQTTPKQSSSGTHLVKYFRSRRVVLHLLFFLILRSLRYNGLMN